MSSRLPLVPFLAVLSTAVAGHAEDAPKRSESSENWLGSPATANAARQGTATHQQAASGSEDWFGSPATADAVGQDTAAHQQAAARAVSPSQSAETPSAEPGFSVPQKPKKLPSRAAPTVPVRFEPDDASVLLLDQNGLMPYENLVPSEWPGWWGWPYSYGYYRTAGVAPVYSPICDSSCVTQLRRGPHHFALAKQGGPIVPINGQVTIAAPSVLRARYVDRSSQRALGIVIGVVGALGGLAMMVASVHDEQQCDGYTCTTRPTVDDAWAISGVAVFAGSIITSAVLLNQRDSAEISLTPLRLAQPDPRSDAHHGLDRNPLVHGAALTLGY